MPKIVEELISRIESIQTLDEFETAKTELLEYLQSINKELVASNFKYQRSSKEKNIIYSLLNKTSQDLNNAIKSLKIRAEELSTLLSAIPAFVYFKNENLEYQVVNKSFEDFLEVRLEDIKGKKVTDFLSEYNNIKYEEKETEVLKHGLPVYGIEEVIIKDKKKIWLSTNIAPVKNSKGDVVGLVGVSYDITERKKYEIELKRAKEQAEAGTRAKSEFLANVSHEIRTPMNGIIGMTEILKQTRLTREQLQNLNTIENSADSLLSLINDVLDFSKIEAGKLNFEIIQFSLNSVLSDVEKILSARASEKGLEFKIFTEHTIPEKIIGDPHRLKQVILNLANNAVKFTSKGSVKIFINLLEKNRSGIKFKFEVQDTGIGISKEAGKMVFKEFTQLDASTTRKFGGTGLGLSISKKLAHLMNGEIGVESEVGKGSTFWFTAKFGRVKQRKSENLKAEQEKLDFIEKLEKDLSVLLVEDNKINQKIAIFNLKKAGYLVDLAENGKDAVEKFESGNYDLILMDILMPIMNGFKATEKIRAIESKSDGAGKKINNRIPIVALTANAMKGDREACLAAGMDGYISKPFKQAELVELLKNIVSQK
nr:response regulator [Bacteroidota bacterium]